MPQLLLLELPTDLLRLILSSYVARSPLSLITARFVCRRFRGLLPILLPREPGNISPGFCTLAAADGSLELIKWSRANGCSWDILTCAAAAEGGYLEVLKWARANGCPWSGFTIIYATLGGQLEVVQWAKSNGCPDYR